MITIEYLRQFRILNFAIFDFALSFLGIYLLSPLLGKLALKVGLIIPMSTWLYWTLPIGVLTHILTGNITPMTAQLLDPSSGYFVKLLVLTLIILGSINISRV